MFKKEFISLDIGTKYIKIATGKEQKNYINISNVYKLDTPSNVIRDGNITDLNSIKSLILQEITKKKIKAKKAIVTIQSSSIIKRELILPKVKKDELDSMVKFEIEQYLPIILDDYLIDYKVLQELEEDNIKKLRILVIIVSKDLVENYLKLIKELNLKPYALDINSNVISKLFSQELLINGENYSLDKTVAVIDLGYSNINVNIISKGILSFSRLINYGGNDLDVNIANSFNLELAEAEKKKIENVNLLENRSNMNSKNILNNVIKNTLDIWLEEIDKIFNYYTSRNPENRIDCIYLYGGSSNLIGIEDYFTQKLNIETSRINDINYIKLNKEISDTNIPIFLNSISAIIRR